MQTKDEVIRTLSAVTQPIEMYGVTVNPDGGLTRSAPQFPINFGFRWRNMGFRGEVNREEMTLSMTIMADVGRIPFSAESAGQREQMLEVAAQIGAAGAGEVRMLPGGALALTRQSELASERLTHRALITQIATDLLSAAPYLDILAECGIKPQTKLS
jgi:hypothetical protein